MKFLIPRLQFLIIPAGLCLLEFLILNQMFPLYSGPLEYDMDPAYQYLFNSVFILNGQTPFHIDHPGTPLQLLCAIIILIVWTVLSLLGATVDQISLSVAMSPELYLKAISSTLVLVNAWALYYLGVRVYRSTQSIGVSLFCQCVLFSTSILIFRIGYPSPESLLIFITVCLLGLLSPLIFNSNTTNSNKTDTASPVWAGVLCGLGVAIKLNFLPVLGLLLLFNRRKQLFISLSLVIVGWFIGILPIISKVPVLFDWVLNVATHSGVHGSGKKGIFVFTNFAWHSAEMYKTFTFFYVLIGFLIFIFLIQLIFLTIFKIIRLVVPYKNIKIEDSLILHWRGILESRVPFVFSLIFVAQTFVVLKHPGLYYMVPVLPIGFMGAAWLANQIFEMRIFSNFQKYCGLALFAVSVVWCATVADKTYISISEARYKQNEALAAVQKVLSQYPNAIVVSTYRSNLPLFSVMYGLAPPWAPSLGPSLKSLFENFYIWDGGVKKLLRYDEPFISVETIKDDLRHGKTVLLSTPMLYPDLKIFILEPLVTGPIQELYKISGIVEQ